MLILTRRPGESIIIGGEKGEPVVVTVLGGKGNSKGPATQVRLGINASPDISVHREEIWHRIQEEKQRNQQMTASGLSEEELEDQEGNK